MGEKQQNNAYTSGTFFEARWGHAVAAIEFTDDDTFVDSRMFLLGGDTTADDDLRGGYGNDVWESKGAGIAQRCTYLSFCMRPCFRRMECKGK